MIEKLELTKTNQSHCHKCKKLITKGEARGIECSFFMNRKTQRYYCLKCSKKMIKNLLKVASKYLEVV